MARVIKTVEIEGKPAKDLFDTGAFHSYVLRKYLESVPTRPVAKQYMKLRWAEKLSRSKSAP
jgi:hypothetical protein